MGDDGNHIYRGTKQRSILGSLRVRFLLLLVLIIIPIAALVVYSGLENKKRDIQYSFQEAQWIARAIGRQQENLIETSKRLLISLSLSDVVQNIKQPECNIKLRKEAEAQKLYYNIAIADLSAHLVASAYDPPSAQIYTGDRLYYKRVLENPEFQIGEQVCSRTTGKRSIHFAYPIKKDGILTHVLLAAYDLDTLGKLPEEAAMPPDGVLEVCDRNGILLQRIPRLKNMENIPLQNDVWEKMHSFKEADGVFMSHSSDGTKWLNAFHRLDITNYKGDIYIKVSIPESSVAAKAENTLQKEIIILSIIALLALIFVWALAQKFFLNGISLLKQAARNIAAGDLSARAFLSGSAGEMADLAADFNSMGDSLLSKDRHRKNLESKLSESEERFRTLVANMPVVAYRCKNDEHWTMDYMSDFIWKISGYPASDFIQNNVRSFQSIINPSDRTYVKTIIGNALSKQQSFTIEYRIKASDGTIRWISEKGQGIYDENGNLKWIDGVLVDCTDAKIAEKVLQDSENRYRTLFEHSRDAVMILEPPDWIFISSNPAACRIFNAESAAELMKTPAQLSPETQPNGAHSITFSSEIINEVMEKGYISFEWYYKRLDGQIFPASIELAKYIMQDKVFLQSTIVDLTNKKRAEEEKFRLEEELRQSQKMESIGRLAGGIAHDFNNLLLPIMGFTELAMLEMPKDAPNYELLREIQNASKRARELTRQLLAFSRKQVLNLKVNDLSAIVASFEKLLRRTIRENITITLDCPPEHMINADEGQIEQILMNLCLNAQDAMPNGGTISIENRKILIDKEDRGFKQDMPPGKYIMIAITDSGHGIDSNTMEHLFEPFYTTKAAGKGTGLGLATVYGIVKQHKSFIHVYSEKDMGSTFKIFFPESSAPKDTTAPAAITQTYTGNGETILLVEDNPNVRYLARIMLEKLNYKTISANSPAECLRLTEDTKPEIDLLLTDVIMPEMNGHQLVKKLRATIYPELKVLYMSGYSSTVISGIKNEKINFIYKPFSISELAAKIYESINSQPSKTETVDV